MLTSCVLSNISYNTEEFLKHQLNELLAGHQIKFWCYIKHKKEDEELKDHIHLIIFPDTQINTIKLDDHFAETVKDNKPLKCMLWTKVLGDSGVFHWFLYCVHDPVYLKLKYAEDKKIHYRQSDFVYSDLDIFANWYFRSYHEFDFWKSTKYRKFIDAGMSCKEIVKSGYVDLKEMVNFAYFSKIVEFNNFDNSAVD